MTDFVANAIHELVHGLGFISDLDNQQELVGADQPFLVPMIYKTPGGKIHFGPFTAYDALIQGNKSFKQLGALITTFPAQIMDTIDYLKLFAANETLLSAAQDLYHMSTDKLIIPVDQGELELYSPPDFENGSSIAHVDSDLVNTPEFIMVETDNEHSLKDSIALTMSKNGYDYVLGPKVISVLSQMGYATKENPIIHVFSILGTFETDLYRPSMAKYVP